jgi:hypothetical protein
VSMADRTLGQEDHREEERVWHAGRLEPMPIRKMPEAPASLHILGPAMILVALGVGLGETYMWPRLVLVFGPEIRWLFLIGVTLQAIVMTEFARYAIATGESIFFGAARVAKPLMWFFFVVAILLYIWPGHVSAGADAFEQMTGVSWVITAIIGILLIGAIYSFANIVYNAVERILTFLVGFMVVGSAIVAAIVGTLQDVWLTIYGLFTFGYMPEAALTSAWFPIIVGSVAFAGPSGMQQMWYTLYLRDKGAGMGVHIPRIRGLMHTEEEETMPARGYMFDTEDSEEMDKWKGWRRWILFDAIVLFWGITMLVTIVFTVLAQRAGRENPNVRQTIETGEESAAIEAMASAFASAGGAFLGILFFLFIAVVGWKGSLGVFDAFSRGQADMTYYFIPGMRRFKMSHVYFLFLWGVIIFGILIILFGPADGPSAILGVLAFLSTFVMGAYCLLLLLTNNLLLPRKIRPNIGISIALAIGAVFYLGLLFYSIFAYGALPD